MHIDTIEPNQALPVDRGYVLSMVIRTFKGRRDVEVHLYRSAWDEAEMDTYDWGHLLGGTIQRKEGQSADPDSSKKVLLEAFTREERDQIIDYLSQRYASRLTKITAAPLGFPIPQGLVPLSSFPEGKTIGTIKLDKIPNYSLPFPVRGLYDLSRHKPLVEAKTDSNE
ncbi:hypothetical protein [Desulfoplanes formicivorans]|uniref:Uncharacterized protein n=1 Tax=Desulfoplanes formicivorans TaxID=1592317 RepID=A0A194AKB7_9BACT|nr:hypothetical protein [Desulfoplanes formicivorans]GAU09680.1 hypothetical protein DPF_2411 [Desulfoplanes formicivorans]